MTDYIRLKQDAEYVLDLHGAETPNGRLALTILHALEHGLAPEGHAIVRKPSLSSRMAELRHERESYRVKKDAELLHLGVPQR